MKKIVAGIVAHVDAGKTTLSEALLYQTGALKKLGRVDSGDAFLDPEDLEKSRGITIFSHQANLQYHDLAVSLLDTPGHVDFASQMEQILSVLDYAILVVSATEGVQGYTQTLWRLLAQYDVPTFIFVNKLDAPGTNQNQVLTQLQETLSAGILPFSGNDETVSDELAEEIALQDEAVLDGYLANGTLDDNVIQTMIAQRQVFPVYFGSGLKMAGIDDLLAGLAKWTQEKQYDEEFAAKVFKISHENGERLTWIRATGGSIANKEVVFNEQKVNQLRRYNGTKYTVVPKAIAGDVLAIPGLTDTFSGQGLGAAKNGRAPIMQPVLTYSVDLQAEEVHTVLAAMREQEDEDPLLKVSWSEQLQEIRVQLMGMIQLEVLKQELKDRFKLDIGFNEGGILYLETITHPVEGIGHFEPLRHYAEVHLLMEPTAPGSGLTFATDCDVDVLGKNWQHQVISSLKAKTHLGTLVGAPLTDIKITLVVGKASIVHSVGGDFREATWRAVRQGLMMTRQSGTAQLLEPCYQFRLQVPQTQIGRAMTDIQAMSGQFEAPTTVGEMAVLVGSAPVSEMQDYARSVQAYTHGKGQLDCVVAGYQPAHNAEDVVTERGYQPVSDLANTPDSVFCAHGAGYPVAWNEVPQMAHVPYVTK